MADETPTPGPAMPHPRPGTPKKSGEGDTPKGAKAAPAGPNTTERLRREIDGGKTGDKTPFQDPAAAPLGTDDEAAGTPNTEAQVRAARAEEVTRANETLAGDAPGRGSTEPGGLPHTATRAGIMGTAEVNRGHDDSTFSAPSSDSTAERPRTVADLQGQPDKPGTSLWAVGLVVVALILAMLLIF